jgi:hypothetical protein
MSLKKHPFLSNISKIFIKRIAQHYKEGIQKSIIQNTISISEIYTSDTTFLKKGGQYRYINEEIRRSIDSCHWIGKTISFIIHSKKITVHLIHPCKSIQKDIKKIERFFQNIKSRIFAWLYVASLESEKGCSKDLSIYIYFTDFKKELPAIKKTPLDEINVNTGFTFSCSLSGSGENEMYIYRKEEWFKVLIHESFHAFSLDFSSLSRELIENADREIKETMFPLHIDLRYYETYCEMWAEILQIIYANMDEILQNNWSNFERMLLIDQRHSLKQGAKILKHHNMEYTDLFEKSEKSQIKRMEYREISPVISYYILKSLFYMNLSRYIEWTSINNRGSLCFLKTEHSLKSYIGLLREIYQYPKYIKYMEKFKDTDFKNDKHLRMSCIEVI